MRSHTEHTDFATRHPQCGPATGQTLYLWSCDMVLQRVRACARRHRVRVTCRLIPGTVIPADLAALDVQRITSLLRNIVPSVTRGDTLTCTIAVIGGSVTCRTRYTPANAAVAPSDLGQASIDEFWSWQTDVAICN